MVKTELVLVPLIRKGLRADVGVHISIQCLECARFDTSKPVSCLAFPEGIPAEILSGKLCEDKV